MTGPNSTTMSSATSGSRKAGNWTRWYRDAIKLAEDRYARYLATPPEEIQ